MMKNGNGNQQRMCRTAWQHTSPQYLVGSQLFWMSLKNIINQEPELISIKISIVIIAGFWLIKRSEALPVSNPVRHQQPCHPNAPKWFRAEEHHWPSILFQRPSYSKNQPCSEVLEWESVQRSRPRIELEKKNKRTSALGDGQCCAWPLIAHFNNRATINSYKSCPVASFHDDHE